MNHSPCPCDGEKLFDAPKADDDVHPVVCVSLRKIRISECHHIDNASTGISPRLLRIGISSRL